MSLISSLALLALAAGCASSAGSGDAADSGVSADTGSGPPRCAESRDAAPTFALTTLQSYCALVSSGSHNLDVKSGLERATECGEPLAEEDLPHLPSSLGHVDPAPSCSSGALAERLHRFETSIALGRMAYDPDKARACAAAGRGRDGGTPITNDRLISPCAEALVGLVPVGGACSANEECRTRYCRPGGVLTCEGACAELLSRGTLCEPNRDFCAEGLECKEEGSAGPFKCLAKTGDPERKARLGEHCDPRSGPKCENRCLACDEGRSVCIALGSAGAPCAKDAECLDSMFCNDDLRCEMRPRRGERCVRTRSNPSGYCLYAGDFCRRERASDVAGICAPIPQLCEACGNAPQLSTRCAEGSCEAAGPRASTICVLPDPDRLPRAGSRCDADGRCARDAFCKGAFCRSKREPGASCTEDQECGTGYCQRNARTCAVPCADGCVGNYLDFYGYLLFFAGLVRVRAWRRRAQPVKMAR